MLKTSGAIHLAYFITPHGFGHAARACAIMEAIHKVKPCVFFEIFTTVPEWFFHESLTCSYEYHSFVSDVGLIQLNSMQEDIEKTIQHLNNFFPFKKESIEQPGRLLVDKHVQAVFCDISPIGLDIAQNFGIPSVLIENFTWDWIYAGYSQHQDSFSHFISAYQKIFSKANIHIQTVPACNQNSTSDLRSSPVSRTPRNSKAQIREQLGLKNQHKVALITMGGIPGEYSFIQELTRSSHIQFVIPGSSEKPQKEDNVILLPHHSNFFHPDLVHASDLVIGKVGYSTLAETYQAGIPFVFLARKAFRESACLVDFIQQEMVGIEISEHEFQTVEWTEKLPDILKQPRLSRTGHNGADQIAQFLLGHGVI